MLARNRLGMMIQPYLHRTRTRERKEKESHLVPRDHDHDVTEIQEIMISTGSNTITVEKIELI